MEIAAVLPQTDYYFLQGGGELGELTRKHDWASTALGTPDSWPQSLRTSVSTVLNSGFPMLLFWGNDMICFYNDGFRPSLGDEGRHPSVGRRAQDMWNDIWDTIGPMLNGVKETGQPLYFENMLVPFNRDGKLEDIYWTFSYSAVYGDSGEIEGIMVICNETTEIINVNKKLTVSDARFQQFVDEAALGIVILNGPQMRIEMANEAYGQMIDKKAEEVVGKRIFDVIPETEPYFRDIIEKVRVSGEPIYLYDYPYFIMVDGEKRDGYLDLVYQPYRDADKNITGVMILCHDVTEKVMAKKQLEESEQRLRSVIEAAPMPIGVMTGKEMRVTFANKSIKEAWGKGNDIEGMTFSEMLPELKGKGFYESLDKVFTTGEAFHSRNERIELVVDGVLQPYYYNYSYSPLFDSEGNVYGVMNTASNVTDIEVARQKVEESEQQIRSIIDASPFPVGVYVGEDKRILMANKPLLALWGKGNDVIGKKYADVHPELTSQSIIEQFDEVYKTGNTIARQNRRLIINTRDGEKEYFLNYTITPLKDTEGKIYGVISTAADVTDLNIAKRQVEESEQNLRNMILQAPVAMCIIMGDEHKIEVANDMMIELWGKPKEMVMGLPIFEALPDAREQGLEQLMEMVYKNGETFKANEMPMQLYRKGKFEDVYQNFVYEPYRNANGDVIGVLAITIDVTPQVLSRRRTEDSEQQVRSIIDSTPFPIGVYTGPEKTIAFANQSIMDVWGKGNDVVGKTYTEILPELENQEIFQQVTAVYETGVPFHARNQRVDLVIDDKLQSFWFNYSFTPVYDAEGKVYGVMNTAAEVTDLNIAKQRIEASEKGLRNIILQAPVAMCIYSGRDFVIDIANEKMFEFWGKDASVIGKALFTAIPEAKDQGYEELLTNILETGKPFAANELTATLMRDGKLENVFLNCAFEPIITTTGDLTGIFATAIDVTAQVKARLKIEEIVAERTEELATANQNLHRSNAELEQFAYIASHDLQEPLRKVGTFAQMLESTLGENISDRAKDYLEKINNSTGRMTGLIRDVLNYSQLSPDEQQTFKKVNLNTLIEGIKSDYELLITQKNAKIISGKLPIIEALPQQMSQLFSNLISNALKFSKERQPTTIEITAELLTKEDIPTSLTPGKDTNYYKIQVTDNGIGFNQEHAGKIFNIFQRLHGKTEYSGTGIGLAMCKKIALNHHGDIYATSQHGKGATFTIILPEQQM